ncbi:MAG: peptidoglycan-binding domain-containing protein, partial [Gammaproteobacteria bacterium]
MKNAFNVGGMDENPSDEFESLFTAADFASDPEQEFRRRRPIPSYRARGVRSVPRFGRFGAALHRRKPGPALRFRGPIPRRASICSCPAVNCPQHGDESVRWVQSTLNRILNLRLPVTGIMDAATRSALRGFQEQQGLPADGIAGPDTQSALVAAAGGGMSGSPDASAVAADWDAAQEFGMDRETSPSACAHFTPIAVEKPGGGRIKNKNAPKASEIVRVSRAFGGKVPLHRLAAA